MWSFKIGKWKPLKVLSCEKSEVPGGKDSAAGQGSCKTRTDAEAEPSDAELNDKVSISTRPVRNNGTSLLFTRINKGYFTRSK